MMDGSTPLDAEGMLWFIVTLFSCVCGRARWNLLLWPVFDLDLVVRASLSLGHTSALFLLFLLILLLILSFLSYHHLIPATPPHVNYHASSQSSAQTRWSTSAPHLRLCSSLVQGSSSPDPSPHHPQAQASLSLPCHRLFIRGRGCPRRPRARVRQRGGGQVSSQAGCGRDRSQEASYPHPRRYC